MAENLPEGFVPDAPPPEGFVPDTAAPEGFILDEPAEPANVNVGVMAMPSRAEQMAAPAGAPTGLDTAPGAYTVGGPTAFAAYRAQHSGLDSAKAGEALQLSRATGLGPQFAADNAADLRAEHDRAQMAAGLAGAPALSAYVNRSAVHAAAAKESVGPLAALEQGLMDLGYQVAAEMEFESPGTETAGLAMSEAETAAYEKRESPWYADLLRSAPTLATYYLLGAGGKLIGGKGGEFTATAGAMFMLNRGTLYRQIIREMPIPASDEEAAAMGWKGTEEYEQRARTYATAGAGASAALGAGLSTAIGIMFPGAAPRAASLANGLIARAFSDAATRDIVQRLASAGGHTLSGALMMAIPAVVDDATVQEAVRGHVDPGKAAVAGWEAFKKSLLAAGALSTLPHVVPIVRDIGRINRAGEDAARLQSHVDQANQADLPPDEKREVIGRMVAQSDVPQVHVDPDHLSPEATQKLVETLADDGQSLAEAKALGVEVPVPTEKYLTDLADQHETLKQDVKLDPDGLTPRQAEGARAGVQAQTDTLGSLMAARDYALQTEPESPERTAKLQDLESRMRSVAARGLGMPETGKGTPEEVAAEMAKLDAEMANRPGEPTLQPEQAQALRAALEPKAPEPAPIPASELRDHAARAVEGKTIGELQPGRYERAAQTASDRIARFAERQATGQAAGVRQPGEGAALGRVVKLSDLTQARDLARAMAKKVGEVRAEMDGLAQKAVDGYTQKARQQLLAADPTGAYLGAADAIMAATGLAPDAPTRGTIEAAVARLDADARMYGFDAQAIADLLAPPEPGKEPRRWKDLTPAEARNVADALASIREAARDINEQVIADRRATMRERLDELRQHFVDIKRIPEDFSTLPAPSRASETSAERRAGKIGTIRAEFHQPREILRRMGTIGREAWDGYLTARNYEAKLQGDVGDRFAEMVQVLPKELKEKRLDGVRGVGSSVVNDNLWVRQDLLTLAGWFGSESGAQRIRDGLLVSDEQILTALSQLEKPEAQFIDALHAFNDEQLWPLVRDHETSKSGGHPPKIEARPYTVTLADGETHTFRGGYWPGKDADPRPRGNDGDIASYWGGLRDGFPTTSKSFTKERAQKTSYRPDLNWNSYASHVYSVLHYLAFDDWVRNFGRLLGNKEFREVASAGLGRPGPQDVGELDKFVTIAARGRMEAPKMGASEFGRLIGGGLRSRVATAAFQAKLPVILGQTSHLAATPFATEIGLLDMLEGTANAFRPEKWNEYHAESQQLPYRWNGYGGKMREMFADLGPQQRAEARKALDAAGHAGYHLMDGFLSTAIYGGGKAEARSRGLSDVEAVKFADDKVATMMPPLNLAEQSSIARDRGLIGSLLLVRNFPNQLYNIGAMKAWDAHNRILAVDPGWQKLFAGTGVAMGAAASYVGMMWAVHVLGRFTMGHGRQEDETTPQWLARGAIAAPFYPGPIASDLAEIGAHALVSHKSLTQIAMHGGADVQSAPLLAEFQTVIRELGEVSNPGKSSEQRVVAGLKLAANIFNIGDYPLKPIQYGYDLQTGKVRPRGSFDIAGGFLYGQRPRQSRNPFTAAQDIQSGRFR